MNTLRVGAAFGDWTVIEEVGGRAKDGDPVQRCRCVCGKERYVRIRRLRAGITRGCGCTGNPRQTKHGASHDPLYHVWNGMKQRCYTTHHAAYSRYGGRGIRVCAEWLADVRVFIAWAMANGYARGLDLDRKENDGHYEPGNCRFVTRKVNQRNRRTSKSLTIGEETRPVVEWANDPRCEIGYPGLLLRIKRGEPHDASILKRRR